MNTSVRILFVGMVAATPLAASTAMAAINPAVPPVQTVGPVSYQSGGSSPEQFNAMRAEAGRYPLELDFLWGRGAKETPIAGVDWSITNSAGHVLANSIANGPLVMASLPNGRYTITARYDGKALKRVVHVRKGTHDTVVLDWPE